MSRKIEIIEVSARIIGGDGIQAFTTKRLAAEIGISEAALYRYFKGKNEIIHSVFDHFESLISGRISELMAASGDAKRKVFELFELHKEIFETHPELVFLFFSEGSFIDIEGLQAKIGGIMERKFALMSQLIALGQSDGSISSPIAPLELGKVLMGYFRMYLLKLRLEGNMNNLGKYCAQYFETIDQLL